MTRLHAFNREQLLASARGELFGTAAGRLPNDPMLMFDRITDIHEDGGPHGKGMVRAELDICPDLWFFGCHFIGDPVMPGCLGLDAMWQLTGFFLTWLGAPGKGRALGCGEVKFTGQVQPDVKKVVYKINLKRVINRRLVMGIADGPTEVHKVTLAKQVLKDYQPDNDLFPSYHIPKLREEAQKRFKTELKELRDAYAARQTESA